jgi:hypothetical protein
MTTREVLNALYPDLAVEKQQAADAIPEIKARRQAA